MAVMITTFVGTTETTPQADSPPDIVEAHKSLGGSGGVGFALSTDRQGTYWGTVLRLATSASRPRSRTLSPDH
jgi:hypothetical protein